MVRSILLLILLFYFFHGIQEAHVGQPVVGVVRPQDVAFLLLQCGVAAHRVAQAVQLRHHTFGQIAGNALVFIVSYSFFVLEFYKRHYDELRRSDILSLHCPKTRIKKK